MHTLFIIQIVIQSLDIPELTTVACHRRCTSTTSP